jgi:hypothetical protein
MNLLSVAIAITPTLVSSITMSASVIVTSIIGCRSIYYYWWRWRMLTNRWWYRSIIHRWCWWCKHYYRSMMAIISAVIRFSFCCHCHQCEDKRQNKKSCFHISCFVVMTRVCPISLTQLFER